MTRTSWASSSPRVSRRASFKSLLAHNPHAELAQRFLPEPRHGADLGIDDKNVFAEAFHRDLNQVEEIVQLFCGEALRERHRSYRIVHV